MITVENLVISDHLARVCRHSSHRGYEAGLGATLGLVSSMGRMAAHTGQIVTYDQILGCEHEFAPEVDKLTMDSPAPLRLGPDGKYPVPMPGIQKNREY